jgi:hypothetical protein
LKNSLLLEPSSRRGTGHLGAPRLDQEDPRCILPLAKSKLELPGHGDRYEDCGEWIIGKEIGCLEIDKHKKITLDGKNYFKKIVVKLVVRNCGRAECPICYETWVSKEAKKITHRLEEYKKANPKKLVKHVTISMPKSDYYLVDTDYNKLREKVYKLLKKAGITGGSVIFHPWRIKESEKLLEFSPHFHFIGFGWIKHTKKIYKQTGYVIKNIGARYTKSSIYLTAQYQLSHCGISKLHHTVTWFGKLAYNNFKCNKMKKELDLCPICGSEMRPIKWIGKGEMPIPLPIRGGIYYIEYSEYWIYTARYKGRNI